VARAVKYCKCFTSALMTLPKVTLLGHWKPHPTTMRIWRCRRKFLASHKTSLLLPCAACCLFLLPAAAAWLPVTGAAAAVNLYYLIANLANQSMHSYLSPCSPSLPLCPLPGPKSWLSLLMTRSITSSGLIWFDFYSSIIITWYTFNIQ